VRLASAPSRGFTLIEIMVVIGLIAVFAALAVPAVDAITGANARKSAGELAGAMRYLFDTAALRHVTCRLALDVDGRAWWAECARGRAGIAQDQERAPDEDRLLAERFPDERNAEARKLLARTEFGSFEDRIVRKRELPGSTAFGAISVEGRRSAVESGTAYVYFFAGGRAQRAHVRIAAGNARYTVVLEPFTGRARVTPGDVEVRE
jgi:general secretion pathway protein H